MRLIISFFRSPMLPSMIASVGVHSFLALAFPQVSSSAETTAQPKGTVRVVQLNAQEQARLPRTSQNTALIPNLPTPVPQNPTLGNVPNYNLPPLPAPGSTSGIIPPIEQLPPPPSFPGIEGTQPNYQLPPPPDNVPPLAHTPPISLPRMAISPVRIPQNPISGISPPESSYERPTPVIIPDQPPNSPNPVESVPPATPKPLYQVSQNTGFRIPRYSALPQNNLESLSPINPEATGTPTESPNASPTPTESPNASPTPTESLNASPIPTESPNASPTPTESPNAQNPTPEETPSPSPSPSPSPLSANPIPTIPTPVTPNPLMEKSEENTTNQDAQRNLAMTVRELEEKGDRSTAQNLITFLDKVRKQEVEPKSIAGNYPIEACGAKLEGTTVLAIVIDKDGKFSKELSLIKSSSYPILDNQAKQDIQTQNYPNSSGDKQPILVNVKYEFNQEKCPNPNEANPQPSN